MDLRGMKRRLEQQIDCKAYAAELNKARVRNLDLAPFESVRSVLAVLSDWAPERYHERERLTRALVTELQRLPHPLWGNMLQLAYYPMLSRLRHRILGDAVTGHDLDQLVATTFLEELHEISLESIPDRLCMHLRQNTQRRVFRRLRDEQRILDTFYLRAPNDMSWLAEKHYEPEEDDGMSQEQVCLWPAVTPTENDEANLQDQEEMLEFLIQEAGKILKREELELVFSTLVMGERLTKHALNLCGSASLAEQRRTYQRIKRRHSRARAKLRKVFTHRRPIVRSGRWAGRTCCI